MQKILTGILEAIEDEIKAQQHYQKLADHAEDPMVKKFFEQMRTDEEEHERILRTRYEGFAKMLKANKEK
ncbi:rubrerythrin [Oxobacter pfennigii]|uniref:Rubrerythrin n=1 Tax=Oxobacter pfennigii TaxID=36849 RepID=A0A0N8NSM3_9CLOT|nr:ferritin family protein [Oxobacter pfennigii]KPU42432.1 rubrerythrin [Oxobacter pfennigii]